MSYCCSFCIFALSDTCKKCRDRSSDVITEQDRDCTGKAKNTCHSVRPRLCSKILKDCDGCTAALYHQSHQCTNPDA